MIDKPSGIAAGLLLFFGLLSFASGLRESATYDEPLHIAGGYVSWTLGDDRLDPSNPPLIGYWTALPLLVLDLALPPGGRAQYKQAPRSFSFDFVYRNRVRPALLLHLPRLMNLLLGLGLGWLLWRWARRALGDTAAVAALAAYAFCPMLLAHSRLVTSDIGAALFMTLTFYTLWRWRQAPSPRAALYAGLALGLALATKYSAAILLPVGVLAVSLDPTRRAKGSFWARPRLREIGS